MKPYGTNGARSHCSACGKRENAAAKGKARAENRQAPAQNAAEHATDDEMERVAELPFCQTCGDYLPCAVPDVDIGPERHEVLRQGDPWPEARRWATVPETPYRLTPVRGFLFCHSASNEPSRIPGELPSRRQGGDLLSRHKATQVHGRNADSADLGLAIRPTRHPSPAPPSPRIAGSPQNATRRAREHSDDTKYTGRAQRRSWGQPRAALPIPSSTQRPELPGQERPKGGQ
jgi:hypothetical protein